MNPKISIIVPVYKVEPYIRKCVDSILAQTLTDFELILVDDGSPDNCGVICDEYANIDKRVKVIHKENGGQATARNAALDIAKGDYIGFVDSDDWIEPDMYELLYNMCEKNHCEIANCSSIIYFKNKMVKNGKHSLTIHNRNQSMRAMLEGELYDEVVWTKLIKRNLLEDVRFPVGVMYEDTAFTYKVIHKANKVCCIGASKYHYIKRDDSTMDRAIKNLRIDGVLIYNEMYHFIEKHYPALCDLVILKLANSAMVILNLISHNSNFTKYKKEYYIVSNLLNIYFRKTIKLAEFPNSVKVLLMATKIQPLFYKMLINLSSKRG
ncbi:glycosyltransferase family 2 protein [Neobacillus cucumis]|uniref:glycosyltransferase family 2 protein n=1 Tax=Neobacillus cucumis TaxID=1740721 RepID=UPI001962B76F|nr:glycosyltransferase [Neobacillus cucumis]MBM7651849.1 glycosyltransferase involved in cell wall biosynthesis [Neobacillus cucumis]